MLIKLTEVERVRLDNLVLLYRLETGAESSCSASDELPSPISMCSILLQQGVTIDADSVEAIMSKQLAISDDLAKAIEEEFFMPPGWMSE